MKRAIFLVIALLGGCKSTPVSAPTSVSQAPLPTGKLPNSSPTNYPPETVAKYIEGCSAAYPPNTQNPCSCQIQRIQAQYTFAQFRSLVQAGTLGNRPEVQDIMTSCDSTFSIEAQPAPSSLSQNQPVTQANSSIPYIVGQDGVFLGLVFNNPSNQKSICNSFGAYGSQFMQTSIRNQIGKYGSQFSDLSAYDPSAQKPPKVIQNGQLIGILTKNSQLQGGTDPDVFFLDTCGN